MSLSLNTYSNPTTITNTIPAYWMGVNLPVFARLIRVRGLDLVVDCDLVLVFLELIFLLAMIALFDDLVTLVSISLIERVGVKIN